MDRVIDLVGTSGAIILSISFIPQTLKIYENSEHGNRCFCILMLLCSFMMTIYSYYYKVIPMLIANVSVFMNNSIILIIMKNKNNKSSCKEIEITYEI